MTSCVMLKVWPGERYEVLQEMKNSAGAMIPVWDEMAARYLGVEHYSYLSDMGLLWKLAYNPAIPKHHRAVLMMTYDKVILIAADYAEAENDIRKFIVDFPPKPGHSHHWSMIANILELKAKDTEMKNPTASPAVGWWMTTVVNCPFDGPWNDDTEELGPLDWSVFEDIYEVQRRVSAKPMLTHED